MTERSHIDLDRTGLFEQRLAARLRRYAGIDVRPVDAGEIAARVMRRRRSALPWRLLVAALLAVALLGLLLAGGGGSRPVELTTSTVTFSSPLYRYSVDVPRAWVVTPAVDAWPGGGGLDPPDPAYADRFRLVGSATTAAVRVKAQPVPAGVTAAGWVAGWERARTVAGHCFGSATPWTDTTVNGRHVRKLEWRCGQSKDATETDFDEYAFVSGGEGYVVTGTPAMAQRLVESFRTP